MGNAISNDTGLCRGCGRYLYLPEHECKGKELTRQENRDEEIRRLRRKLADLERDKAYDR